MKFLNRFTGKKLCPLEVPVLQSNKPSLGLLGIGPSVRWISALGCFEGKGTNRRLGLNVVRELKFPVAAAKLFEDSAGGPKALTADDAAALSSAGGVRSPQAEARRRGLKLEASRLVSQAQAEEGAGR